MNSPIVLINGYWYQEPINNCSFRKAKSKKRTLKVIISFLIFNPEIPHDTNTGET